MIFRDPITGDKLALYCSDKGEMECYRANEDKAIQIIMFDRKVDMTEAIRLIENSDIDNPVKLSDLTLFWVE